MAGHPEAWPAGGGGLVFCFVFAEKNWAKGPHFLKNLDRQKIIKTEKNMG